jgi:hypothetical protein
VENTSFTHLTAAQADALAVVVELESLWENVPSAAAQTSASEGWRGLNAKQRAFDAYHSHLVAYNRQYRPSHFGERPATTPSRLGAWCRKMAQLYGRVDRAECPVALLEKVHRYADRLAVRLNATPCVRGTPQTSTADAVADLGAVAEWCDGLVVTATPV